MRRSIGGGHSLKNLLFVNYINKQVLNVFVTKCPHFDGGKLLHCLVRRSFGGGAQSSKYGILRVWGDSGSENPEYQVDSGELCEF